MSDKVTKEIVSKAEIEKGDKSEKETTFSVFTARCRSKFVNMWPAVTIAPLLAPAVATLHYYFSLEFPVQPGIRNNGKACRKCETAFFPTIAL